MLCDMEDCFLDNKTVVETDKIDWINSGNVTCNIESTWVTILINDPLYTFIRAYKGVLTRIGVKVG